MIVRDSMQTGLVTAELDDTISHAARLLFDPEEVRYDFGEHHPMHPRRLQALIYDPFRVVPRAWSLLWAEMAGLPVPERLPQGWIDRWEPLFQARREQEGNEQVLMGKDAAPQRFPTTFEDSKEDIAPQPRRESIGRQNRETAALVRHLCLPSHVRQAFPVRRQLSPLADLFDLLHSNKDNTPSQLKTLETPRGPVFLRDFCPASLVARLSVESGLHAFARLPEHEKQLLLSIAQSPDCALTLAHTASGEIVGQVTIAPIEDWYEGLENAYEVAIEVSTNWRGLGIAKSLLAFALELDALEDMILFAIGLSWHWDLEGLRISPYRYRQLITALFASQGFSEYETSEPDVMMEPANVLLVRVGKRVPPQDVERFRRYLRRTPEKYRTAIY